MELWVGTDDGLFTAGPEIAEELPSVGITAMDVSGDTCWVVADQRRLLARSDGTWAEMATVEPGTTLTCVRANPLGVWVGTTEARLLRLDGDALTPVSSFDEVEQRDRWWNVGGGLGPEANVRSIAASPEGELYVNVHVGGIYRSADGASWQPTIDLDADVHEVLALGGGRLVAATGMSGLVRSDDHGRTWSSTVEGLPDDGFVGYTRSVAVTDDGTILITGSRGPFSEADGGVLAGVYRWIADEDRLERCVEGLPGGFEENIDTFRLTSGRGYAAFGQDDTVYVSRDSGRAWEVLASGLPQIRCVAARS